MFFAPCTIQTVNRTFISSWLKNSSRVHLQRQNEAFAQLVSRESYVLDAGAGRAPYRNLFSHAKYETADFEQLGTEYSPSTYVCDLSSVPVENERFDYIVFNQVMEHLPEPSVVLDELWRILKPGGRMICTCPLFYPEHQQPYDFYRYTRYAHEHLFAKAHFQIDSLEWLEGYFGTVAYQLELMYRCLPVNPRNYPMGILSWFLVPVVGIVKYGAFVLSGIFYRMDIRFKFTRFGMPKNYVVIARKVPKQ